MPLSLRQQKLLDLLEKHDGYLTVLTLAQHLGVSERTIHTELDKLATFIAKENKHIKKKRGVGIKIKPIKRENNQKNKEISTNRLTVEERRLAILNTLLFTEKTVTQDELSEYYFVSKSSIQNDIAFIHHHFVPLTSNHEGTYISLPENDWKKAFFKFNKTLLSIHLEDIHILKKYYGEEIVTNCINILQKFITIKKIKLSDLYLRNAVSALVILIYRIKKGHHQKLNLISNNDEYVNIHNFASSIEKKLNITLSEGDRQYLSHHLYLNKFISKNQEVPSQPYNEMIQSLIIKMEELTGIKFSKDVKLRKQLEVHFPPMMDRLLTLNTIHNPFSQEIKNELIMIYNILLVSIENIESLSTIKFNDDEITFIAVYFQASLERIKRERKILVLNPMGTAISELIVNRLKKFIEPNDSLVLSSIADINKINLSQFDLILSTIDLKDIKEKWLKISIFINEDEIRKTLYLLNSNIKNTKKLKDIAKFKLSTEHYKFISINKSKKQEILTYAINELVEENKVTKEYLNSVLEREKLSSTDFPSGIATPHGSMEYVKKTTILVIRNTRKIKWENYYVDIIFLICIAKGDNEHAKNLISEIYSMIDNPAILNILRN